MYQDLRSPETTPSPWAHAPRKQGRAYRRPGAPFSECRREILSTTALNAAAKALFPWSEENYPGILRGMFELFGGRAARYTIRDWRRGRRKSPAWAKQMMADALEKRIAEMQAALDAIKKAGG